MKLAPQTPVAPQASRVWRAQQAPTPKKALPRRRQSPFFQHPQKLASAEHSAKKRKGPPATGKQKPWTQPEVFGQRLLEVFWKPLPEAFWQRQLEALGQRLLEVFWKSLPEVFWQQQLEALGQRLLETFWKSLPEAFWQRQLEVKLWVQAKGG